jgi:hypothetical protein
VTIVVTIEIDDQEAVLFGQTHDLHDFLDEGIRGTVEQIYEFSRVTIRMETIQGPKGQKGRC